MTKKEIEELAELLKVDIEKFEEERISFNDWSGNAILWIDFEDGHVWTQVEEIKNYDSDTIRFIVSKDDVTNPNFRIGLEKALKLAKLKRDYLEAGESDLLIDSLCDLHV